MNILLRPVGLRVLSSRRMEAGYWLALAAVLLLGAGAAWQLWVWTEGFFFSGLNGCTENASSLPGYQEGGYTPSEAYASCLKNVRVTAYILASAAATAMVAGVIALAVYLTREYLSGRCINLTTGYAVEPRAFSRALRWCGYVALAMVVVYAMILFPVG